MKIIRLSILFISIFVLLAIIKSLFTSYNENIIYSEKVIPQYSNDSLPNNYITREEAVNRTLEVLKNGFSITLDREKVYEDIQIYKRDEDMIWAIGLIEKIDANKNLKYYCEMKVETGEIINIGKKYYRENTINEEYDFEEEYDFDNINLDKLKNIIKPLTEELNIDVREENIKISYNYNGLINLEIYQEDAAGKYSLFVVDYEHDSIISFYRKI
ncbi:hypothetical protein R0131_13005 [Clostridium sp. AL.422]|uniref:hypothetical protein n=1 Tax=Clostridium TaxID=1485 RepID=UPI00293DC666|nr:MULTISPECIES: hypothetical protein [unclassified Clostridium]MDV4151741.1 hypothetical protein [Clostridium sp. AL.422]